MFGRIGPFELILILALALIIFGPRKLPEIGRALGNAFREFRDQLSRLGRDASLDTNSDKKNDPDAPSASRPEDRD